MSKETEVKSPKEDIKIESGSSAQTTASADTSTPNPEQQAAGGTPSPQESPASDTAELKTLMQQLIEINKGQSQVIENQKQELSDLKQRFETLNDEYQNGKPLDRRAEVVGMFDGGKQREGFNGQKYVDEREYAKKLFDNLDQEFPSA